MPSENVSNTPSRRRFLAGFGAVASMSFAGCSGVLPGSDSGGGDQAGEVVVENRTDSEAEIAVRVVGREDEPLFSRVFVLEGGKTMSRGTVETTPTRVHAFTATGVARTWRYDPDLSVEFDCKPKDIGLTLHRDNTIKPWYSC